MKLDRNNIVKLLPDARFEGATLELSGDWTVDSRTVTPGATFVALPGALVNGHEFVLSALTEGARAAIVARRHWHQLQAILQPFFIECMIIIVDDPYHALVTIARWWRNQFSYPVVGITGSIGKTTTKELVGLMLHEAGIPALISRGNQNTRIGIPLNLLRMRPEHQVAVFEMGISRRGEMAELAQLVQPTIGVITAIGHTHLEGLGTIADIAAEKRHIFDMMKPDNMGIVCGDQSCLAVAYQVPIIRFGSKMPNQIQARQIRQTNHGIEFGLKIYQKRYTVQLDTPHIARVYNVLAAAAVAHTLGIDHEAIVRGASRPLSIPGRFARYTVAHHTIIDDSYNACPESMKEALIAFEQIHAPGKKIAVLGDMLELGVNTSFWHRQLGRILRKMHSLDHLILVGDQCKAWVPVTLPHNLGFEMHPTWKTAAQALQKQATQGTVCVLVKGGRRIALDKLVEQFREQIP